MGNTFPFPITLQQIQEAHRSISPYIRKTPLIQSEMFNHSEKQNIFLKLENLQITGSFKLRGAFNKILSLSQSERARGVITVSSGNHGRAVSYAARKLGFRAVICMSDTVPENKVKAIEDLGAQVVIHGASYDEAELHALGLQQREQLTMVHPFDDPAIIAGQGTVGLEILQEISDIDTVIIPLSGGGLFSGIAIAMKYTRPDIHLVGVTMERGPAMVKSLNAGRVVEVLEEPTLADALVGGIGFENTYTFSIVQELMDESILVSEKEISNAMVTAYLRDNLTIEGGGAVGLAALMNQSVLKDRKNIVAIVSGGNVELPLLHKLIQEN